MYLQNPQDGVRYVLSYSDLDREWSGRGLLLASRLDKGHKIERVAWLSQGEMRRTSGACFVVSKQRRLGRHKHNRHICFRCLPHSHGSPGIDIDPISQNIFIEDTPLWYSPPIGPAVEVTISYNSQDASNYNTCFGNKWSFNYGSHVVETSDGRATLFMPDGGQDTYLPDGSGGFISEKGNFDTLVKTGASSYELRFQKGGKFVYGIPMGTSGQQPFLLSIVDRWNNALTFGYNSSVQMTTITDAQGKVTQLQWVSGPYGSRIARVIDPFERHADLSYDDNGNMVQCVDVEGNAFQYTYDASVNVVMLNTAQGPWSFEFHDFGPSGSPTFGQRSTAIWNPLQEQPERVDYDGRDHIGQYWGTDHRQAVTHYTAVQIRSATYSVGYTPIGGDSDIASSTTPTGESVNYTYDPNTLEESSVSSSDGLYTNTTYNSLGMPTQIRWGKSYYSGGGDPNERVTNVTYAPNGLDATGVTNALNQTVYSATYNAQHQPLSVTDQGSHITNFTYAPWGALATETDASNAITSNVYSSDKRVQRVERAGTVLSSYSYDTIGRVKTVTDAGGVTLGYAYNNLDAPTKTTYPDGTYSQIQYVCCGLPGAVRDRAGRWNFYDYDPLKRLVRTQDPAGRSVFYGYDAESNLTSLRDAKGQLTTWRHDASNRTVRKIYADGKWDGLTYESGTGRLKQRSDGAGRVTSYSYDDYGRLSGVAYPTTPAVGFGYDVLNRPTSMTDGLGTSTWSYDAAGHLQSAGGPFTNDALSYHYDVLNRRDQLSIASPSGAFNVNYGYDVLSRLQNITSPAGSFGYSYIGATEMLQSQSLPNGASTTYGYDPLERLTQVQSARNGSNLSSYTYSHDNTTYRPGRTGEVSQVLAEAPVTRSYSYDGVDQLTGEAVTVGGTAQSSASLLYDPMGNRSSATSTSATGTSTTNYGNSKLNQLVSLSTSDGTTTSASTLSYDPSGNLSGVTQGTSGTLYGYDEADRLVRVEVPGQSKSLFFYDGLGRLRISRDFLWQNGAWSQTGEVRRVYDGMNVVQERDANNLVLATYTRSGNIGGILSRTDTNGSLFYHYDGRGNVAQLSDGAGQIQARYSYDAWGNTTASGPAAGLNRFRFSTKEQIGNLYSYGYRFYSPGLGKWINRDPLGERGGLNVYQFAGNNPSNFVDPLGLLLGGADYITIGVGWGLGGQITYDQYGNMYGGWTGGFQMGGGINFGYMYGDNSQATLNGHLTGVGVSYGCGGFGGSVGGSWSAGNNSFAGSWGFGFGSSGVGGSLTAGSSWNFLGPGRGNGKPVSPAVRPVVPPPSKPSDGGESPYTYELDTARGDCILNQNTGKRWDPGYFWTHRDIDPDIPTTARPLPSTR